MIYEKPKMELMALIEESIVCLSQGGTSTESGVDEPEIDWNL